MAVVMSQLRPRQVRYEPTVEQVEAERHRQKRFVLEAQLHDYYRPRSIPRELVYGGSMNLPVDRSDSVTGCELTDHFTLWLQDHALIDPEEAAHRTKIYRALDRLYREQPYAHLVVSEHSRTGEKLIHLAHRWQHGNNRVNDAYWQGIDLILDYLGGDSAQ